MVEASTLWSLWFVPVVIWLIYTVWRYDRREGAIQANWLARVATRTSKSSLIAGGWVGSYEYQREVDQDTVQPDRSFGADLTLDDGFFVGQMKDSLGTADIEGICEYPDIRFRKKYREPSELNLERRPILYRGRFQSANTANGDWKVDDPNRRFAHGTWRMERNAAVEKEL